MKDINYTIVVPHKNSPLLLNRCLNSIPNRDDIEVIVVDDCSDYDKRPHIEKGNVFIIELPESESKGAGHARNVGISHAHGTWILFADCDDCYNEGFIDVLDSYKDKELDVLYYNYNIFDEKNSKCLSSNFLQNLIRTYNGEEEKLILIKYRNNPPWNKMVKRSFILEHKMFFEEVVNGNDILFSLFLAMNSTVVMVEPKSLYIYIQNTDSLSNKTQTPAEILCRVFHIIQHNAFNTFVGHKEWNSSLVRYFIEILRSDIKIVPTVCKGLLVSILNKKIRNNWIDIIFKER